MNMRLEKNDKVAIISCSNGVELEYEEKLHKIIAELKSMELQVELAHTLYRTNGPFAGTPMERGNELMRLFKDKSIKAIFDISGGDAANQILEYLDFNIIRANNKPYFGISDLSVILNTLYSQSGIETYHYTLRNIIREDSEEQIKQFKKSLFEGKNDLFHREYRWIKGNSMKGIVIGGNIRCFLKLAGTKYMPNLEGKILLIEGFGGLSDRISSMMWQLRHLGYLDKLNGIILGTFSQLEAENTKPDLEELIKETIGERKIPIVKTDKLGHHYDAGCIVIGREIEIKK
ncbi:LD-carboxypeptidase [Oceanirhabdus seepicola]|uniref:LD-carboxypeptidase n=1 Tax=Oceanirhabdus seepicola TaxID=2828781 RepID=A0A9J6NZR6_9CLOT|nr:LD-carboxypeptidase [Oceanirhabdus seepicola]